MKKILFIQYPTCSTCQKVSKWLKVNEIEVSNRHIVEEAPSKEELRIWVKKSGLTINKFFNTSGIVYKEKNLKDKIKALSNDELLSLLASNGMLVKRPILVAPDFVLVGFKEEDWIARLK